jgi:hypothetical protein
MKKENKFVVMVDFDGTLNTYDSGFVGPAEIPDPPVKGAKEALELLSKHFKIVIFSVRAETPEGKKAIEEYMKKHELHYDGINNEKQAGLLIDDNCLTFKGNWPAMVKEIANFTHWKESKKEKKNGTKTNKNNR